MPKLKLATPLSALVLFVGTLTAPALAQEPALSADEMVMCTGTETGNYQFAAKEIAARITQTIRSLRLVPTGGSLDNANKLMDGTCNMGLMQSDVYSLYRIEKPASIQRLTTFKKIYTESVQVLCPTASGWKTIQDVGKARGRLIVGIDGSGTAETWRALRRANPALYDDIDRLPQTPDIMAVSTVKDSVDTCMLWVSGLNSPDMQAANAMSVSTTNGKNALVLIDVADEAMAAIKGPDGRPLYEFAKIERREAIYTEKGELKHPALYPNLIANKGGFFGDNYSVTVPVVSAWLVTREDYKKALGSKAGRVVMGIEDAMVTIQKRLNPGG